jgi:hypothetical protein
LALVHLALSPDRTEAGHFHRPSLPINTEVEKRHAKEKKKQKGKRTEKKQRGRETKE